MVVLEATLNLTVKRLSLHGEDLTPGEDFTLQGNFLVLREGLSVERLSDLDIEWTVLLEWAFNTCAGLC